MVEGQKRVRMRSAGSLDQLLELPALPAAQATLDFDATSR
jgi:hypothetical protein